MTDERHEEIRRYLLGGAPPEIQRAVEERLLVEESFLEELSFAEEELIDDYVGGELSADERASFEHHFLSTDERQRKLRFARALTRYKSEKAVTKSAEPSPPRPSLAERLRALWRGQPAWLRAAAAFAVVLALACAWWFSFPRAHSPKTLASLSLSVSAGSNRAEGVQASKVKLPLKEDALKISLRLPEGSDAASRHRVELWDAKGEFKELEVTERDDKSVSVIIPAGQLTRGQYALKLYATRPGGSEQRVSGSYFFTAE